MHDPSDRVGYMGASSAGAALGYCRYSSPLEVWREVTGREESSTSGDAADIGNDFEPVMAKWLGDRIGKRMRRARSVNGSRRRFHPRYPWMGCDVDYFAEGTDWIGELKTTGITGPVPEFWGAEYSDEVPTKVRIQVNQQMGITGRRRAYIGALIGGRGRCVFRVDFSRKLFDACVNDLADWWQTHVLGDTPPPPRSKDDTPLAWPEDNGHVIPIDDESLTEIASWKRTKKSLKRLETELEVLDLSLRTRIGDAVGIGDNMGPMITWPTHKVFNLESFAQEFPAEVIQATVSGKVDTKWLRENYREGYERHRTKPKRAFLRLSKRGEAIE